MHRRLRFPLTTALAAILMTGAAGCGWYASSFEDESVVPQEITAVLVDNDSGGITLRGGEGTDATVHRVVEYRGSRPGEATHRVEDGVLVLDGCGRNCAVRYTVDLPAGLPVTGSTSHGSIELSRMGDVDVTSRNGAIELESISGTVQARTANGRIAGRDLTGTGIRAHSSNGSIELASAVAQDVVAQTDNGSITLTVPDGSYRLSARTRNGGTEIGVADDPSGAHELDLTTRNGSITVTPGRPQ